MLLLLPGGGTKSVDVSTPLFDVLHTLSLKTSVRSIRFLGHIINSSKIQLTLSSFNVSPGDTIRAYYKQVCVLRGGMRRAIIEGEVMMCIL